MGNKMKEEFAAVCSCGITSYSISFEVDTENQKVPRKIIIRCSRCGRIRFMMEENGEDLWYMYDRMPFK